MLAQPDLEAGSLKQTINGVVRGRSVDSGIVQIELQAFDRTYWDIAVRDDNLLRELRHLSRQTALLIGQSIPEARLSIRRAATVTLAYAARGY